MQMVRLRRQSYSSVRGLHGWFACKWYVFDGNRIVTLMPRSDDAIGSQWPFGMSRGTGSPTTSSGDSPRAILLAVSCLAGLFMQTPGGEELNPSTCQIFPKVRATARCQITMAPCNSSSPKADYQNLLGETVCALESRPANSHCAHFHTQIGACG